MKSSLPLVLLVFAVACQPPPPPPEVSTMESMLPPMDTRADSLAMRSLEASGGELAMRSLPYLHFTFGVNQPSRHHLWDRMTGDYRVEYQRADTAFVVLFNTQTQEGVAYKDGVEAANSAQLVERGYSAFINDSYWLLMPAKMLDPGVYREMVPDSSSATHEVVRLTFENVGLTPGDAYYVWVNRETGFADRWHYVLQSGGQQWCNWKDYTEFEGPAGPVRLSETKECSRFVMQTDVVEAPASVPDGAFTDPAPMLMGA
ncbi:MAG: hypothetical protein HKN29_07610 [Rhodothermales bacterium]|nr:hypothetical protein [Rhodothermales bacterium]